VRWLWLAIELAALYLLISAALCLVDIAVLVAYKLFGG